MKIQKTALLATSALAASLAFGGTAFAQSDDVIIVTSQKRQSTLQETPVAVSVVSVETMEQSSIRDVKDMQFLVPSLDVVERSAPGATSYSIRGIGTSGDNFSLEPSVPVYVDGVYRARTVAAINDFIALERVEVLRGPQSTLYGRNAVAGAIAYTTKKPNMDEFDADLEATYGNYNQVVLRGTTSGPIGDNIGFRLSGNFNERDGFVDVVNRAGEVNNRDRFALRGQLLFEPSDDVSIRLIAEHTDLDEDCCAAPFSANFPANLGALTVLGVTTLGDDIFERRVALNGDVNSTVNTNSYSGEVNWDLGFGTLTSITAYDDMEEIRNIDADFTDGAIAGRRENTNIYDAFAQELRLAGSEDSFDWVVGGYYYNQDRQNTEVNTFGPLLRTFGDLISGGIPDGMGGVTGGGVTTVEQALQQPAGTFLAAGNGNQGSTYVVDTEAWAGFAQVDYHVTDRLTLTGGLRLSTETQGITADVNVFAPFSALDLAGADAATVFTVGGIAQNFPGVTTACGLGPLPFSPANVGALSMAPACGGPFAGLNGAQAFGALQTQVATGVNAAAAAGVLTAPCPAGQSFPTCNQLLGLQALQFFPPAVGAFPVQSQKFDDTSFNLIAAYDLSDNVNVYASYSTGYKPGGFNTDPTSESAGSQLYAPEQAKNIEFGMKGRFFDGRLSANATFFDLTLEDFQSNAFNGKGFSIRNAGERKSQGIELEGTFRPTDFVDITYAWTHFTNAEYVSYLEGPCPTAEAVPNRPASCITNGTQDISGATPSEISKDQFVLTSTFRNNIGELPVYLRGELYYRSDYLTSDDTDPRKDQDGFALFNASVGISSPDEKYTLQLWSKNLFGAEYNVGDFNSVGQPGSLNSFPSDPATYGATIRGKF